MKSLVLAEKPSVGKEFAKVLQCNKITKGYCEGPKFIVTWALGHLVTLADPSTYDKKYHDWRLQDLPMLPQKMKLTVIKKTAHQFHLISKLIKRQDIGNLIIATDAGREGELVARWIIKLAGWGNRPFSRLWISSQTEKAIRQGFSQLQPGTSYNSLFYSAVSRAEADWLIGLNVTRALTCKYDFSLNAGRVQTPTLAIIVNREQTIRSFKPKNYWHLVAQFGAFQGLWQNKNGNSAIFKRDHVDALVKKVNHSKGTVMLLTSNPKKTPPPLAYDLTELQRDANRKFDLTAKQTLALVQTLYERHKLVTYPRTDSRYLTSDMLATIPERLKSISVRPYDTFVKPLLEKGVKPTKRLINDAKVTDHHALIPTEEPLQLSRLSSRELSVYDLIARRFLAVLYPDYTYDQIVIGVTINGEKFISKGRIEKDMGWRAVNTTTNHTAEEPTEFYSSQLLSQIKKGQSIPINNLKTVTLQTKAPARFSEASLLSVMENPTAYISENKLRDSIKQGGLGTPATRAEIIDKLISNLYLERKGRELLPTAKAYQLMELVPEALKTPVLTAKWELRLANIANGSENANRFIADIRKNAVTLVTQIKESTATCNIKNTTGKKCPMCSQGMISVKNKRGNKLVCMDRRCGYEEYENSDDMGFGKRSKKEIHMNRKLIKKYSDNSKAGTSLGDLLKEAMKKKK